MAAVNTGRTSWDVVVVGAGPVGSLLAGALAKHGASVLVLEREADIVEQTRASTLNSRSMEILSSLDIPGLADRPRSAVGHYGGIPVGLDDVDSPWSGLWKMPQPELVRLLRSWAAGHGAIMRTGATFTHARTVSSAVVSYCGAGQASESLFLVGADGADSTLRAGRRFTPCRAAATRYMIRCDVKGVAVTPRRFERHGSRVTTAGQISPGITRLMIFDPRYRATDTPTFEDVCRDWLDATGERVDGGDCVWLDGFSNGCSTVAEWNVGNVFLAGDAAHDQPPVGGSSLNAGLQDAHNLAWKLAGLLGGAPPELAATYGPERAEVTARMQESVREQETLIFDPGLSARQKGEAVRDHIRQSPSFRRRVARSISDLDTHYLCSTQTGPRLSAKQFETILRRVPLGSEQAALDRQGVIVVASPPPARAAASHRGAGYRLEDVLLVVRPDGHVAWVPGRPDADPASVIKRWFGDFHKPAMISSRRDIL